ncbi:MAG TPA: methyltransferase domain-containing protein [Cyclobacteriaceae bacterium]|nr:methyltransferase domain-containing protein [Cyclobacteriaceae bacterium]
MDDLQFHHEVVFQTLRELDFINRWLGGNAVTLNAVEKLRQTFPGAKTVSMADLGCGSGEMLRLIATKANQEHWKTQLTGIDANPHIIDYARSHSLDFANIRFEALNIFSGEFQALRFDVIIATLFIHHFSEEELIHLFSLWKKQAAAIIVNDIHRHPVAYFSIKWLTSVFSKSSMVRYDAPLSVLRAFTREEIKSILAKAGIENYKLKWKWAFRWQLTVFCGIMPPAS